MMKLSTSMQLIEITKKTLIYIYWIPDLIPVEQELNINYGRSEWSALNHYGRCLM